MKESRFGTANGGAATALSSARDTITFEGLLAASTAFTRLDTNVRASPLPDLSLDQLEQLADELAISLQVGDWDASVDMLIEGSVHYSHTGFLKQQLNAPLPGAAIGALWAAILNQGQAVFEMAPLLSIIEARILGWARERLGLGPDAFGLSTGGGTLANLSALLAARNKLDGWTKWTSGASGPLRVLCAASAHYSLTRAVSILGIGSDRIETVPSDANGRIDIDELLSRLDEVTPTIVVLNAGTTVSGAFDDIAYFVERHRRSPHVWVHVDACHGGSFYDTPHLSRHFSSFSEVDSICWDLHKAYFQSTPLSLLFFRSREYASYSSNHAISYLAQDKMSAYPDMHNWTLECSRTANALKLWLSLQLTGEEIITAMVRRLHDCATAFEAALAGRFETTGPPDTNIVAFRPGAAMEQCSDDDVAQLVEHLEREFGLVLGTVEWKGQLYAKACFMNPRITLTDVATMIDRIDQAIAARGTVRPEFSCTTVEGEAV